MAKKFNRKTWLISQLRRLSIKYPPRLRVLNGAKSIHYITAKNGNPVKRVTFTCTICKKSGFKQKEVEVDHIIEVVDVTTGWTNFGDYVERLFCEESNLRLLCKACHLEKTKLSGEIKAYH